VRPRGDAPFPELEVRNPVRQTRYRVLLPAWPSRESAMCVCTDFARRGLGTCKHLEAAWNWLAVHPEPLPVRADVGRNGAWARVDQARRALPRSVTPQTLRQAGDVLFLPG
jgi:hypothetical protein